MQIKYLIVREFLWAICIGVMGSYFGGFLFDELEIEAGGYVGSVVTSVVGAVLRILIFKKLREGRASQQKN